MEHDHKKTALDSFVDPSAPICYGILKPGEHFPDGIPVIKVKNIVGGRIFEDGLLRTSPQIHSQYKRAEVKEGDLLLTIRGTTGRVAIVPPSLSGANITQDTARIRVSKDDHSLYVFYALQSPNVQRQIDLNTVGQAVKGINIAEVKKLRIFHPAGEEQKKIAKILSTWDKAITTTEQLLANSQQQKKALMQQLLTGKKRLLNKDGVRFDGGWKIHPLKKLLQISKGDQLNKDTLSKSGEYPVINGGIEPSGYTSQYNTEASTITISEGGNSCGFVGFQSVKFWCGGHCYAINSLKTDLNFTYQLLKFNQSRIMRLRVGSGLPNIQKKDLESLSVSYPISHEEQQRIAAVLSAADHKIDSLMQQLQALKNEKKALMQQLLTGKRRVKTGS